MSDLTYLPLNNLHAESLLPIWSEEDVIKFTNIQTPCTLEDVRNRIDRLRNSDVFVVIQEENVIGIIGCPCIDKEKLQYGIFYQFSKSAWGKGIATASTKWLLQFMEHKYLNPTLFADVVVDNVASVKILNRFGFKLVSETLFERNGVKMKIHNYIRQRTPTAETTDSFVMDK